MEVHLNYQNGQKVVSIPGNANVTVLQPEPVIARESLSVMLSESLQSSCFMDQLKIKAPSSIAIVIPDDNRPEPVTTLLPEIIARIFEALPRMEPASVTIIFGNGLQSSPNREAIDKVRSSVLVRSCNIVAHDARGARMTDFGATRRGTPVSINASLGEVDFKIVIGFVEPHQFIGFTGGARDAVIGCASADTIGSNHNIIKELSIGTMQFGENPVQADLDEIAGMVGIDFAVNVVLNTDRQVVHILAGSAEGVLRQGVKVCSAVHVIELQRKFDIVLASCANSPQTIRAYQAQKSFSLISRAAERGGKILLLAAFQRGFGEDVYFDYACPFVEPDEIAKDFINFGYAMGPGVAYSFGGMLQPYQTENFNGLESQLMKHCHLRAADPSTIMAEWVDDYEGTPEVAVIPDAVNTYICFA